MSTDKPSGEATRPEATTLAVPTSPAQPTQRAASGRPKGFYRRLRHDVRRPVFLVNLVTLVMLGIYTAATLRLVVLSQRQTAYTRYALELTRQNLEVGNAALLDYEVFAPERLVPHEESQFRVVIINRGRLAATKLTPLVIGSVVATAGVRPEFRPPDNNAEVHTVDVPPIKLPKEKSRYDWEPLDWSIHVEPLADDVIEALDYYEPQKILYLYAVFRYWNGFNCKRLRVCATYIPHSLEGPESCGVGQVRCRTDRNCGWEVHDQEEGPPEMCGRHPAPPEP